MEEINKIAEDLKTETNPIILVDYLTKLAGWAAYYEGLLQPIQLVKPEKWLWLQQFATGLNNGEVSTAKILNLTDSSKDVEMKREKPLSDKKTEMVWLATKEGQEEIRYTSELKKIALMTAAIKQNLWAKRIEYKNLHPDI